MKENKVLYKACKLIYTTLLKILYRPTAIGAENIPEDGAIIFAGNHRHAFDPVVVMTHTKRIVHYMAKETLFKGLHGILFKHAYGKRRTVQQERLHTRQGVSRDGSGGQRARRTLQIYAEKQAGARRRRGSDHAR